MIWFAVALNSVGIIALTIATVMNTKLIKQILESKWFPTPREVRKDEVQ